MNESAAESVIEAIVRQQAGNPVTGLEALGDILSDRVITFMAAVPPQGSDCTLRSQRCSDLADGEGFEPSVPCGTHAFQACPIDRSGTHPKRAYEFGID
jgi:hypothetical protein